jgi:hypothetical protein
VPRSINHRVLLAAVVAVSSLCLPSLAAGQPTGNPLVFADRDGPDGEEEPGDNKAAEPTTAIIDGPAPPEAPDVVARDERGRVTVRAVRLAEPLVIDGRLDDAAYTQVPSIGDFVQQEPREGEPASEKTEIWVLFDERTFYLSARCWDSEPDRIVAKELRRGNTAVSRDDSITLTLDTFYDRRNGFYFQTNTLGAVYEALVTDERSENADWDTVWDTRSARFDGGWSVEIAIPFKSLRYPRGGAQIWGLNVRRTVPRNEELDYLSLVPASYGRIGIWKFSSAATLVGLETPAQSVNFELKPYGISTLTTDRAATPTVLNDLAGDAGFDVKYGLTKGLIADFTYNTDFAQVEVDETQVNLTRFSLFFPEKRPFFLEGQDIFAFGGVTQSLTGGGGASGDTPILFFSRQIGLTGSESVPILAGGRVTGRAGAYSVGLLNIGTDEAPDGTAEPTNFSVVRLKRNILGRSSVGLIATHRSEALETPGSNTVYGLDSRFALLSNFFIDAYYARSLTEGRTGNDFSYRTRMENNGDRYGFQFEHLRVGDDFNPEVGFMRRTDFRRTYGQLRFSPRHESSDLVRKYFFEASLDYFEKDSTGAVETRDAKAEFEIQFENGERWRTEYDNQYELLTEPFEISEGVVIPIGGYSFQTVRTSYNIGPQRRVSGNVALQAGSFFDGDRGEASFRGRIQLASRLLIEPGVTVNRVELPQGDFTTTVGRLRVIYSMTARQFVEAMPQYNSEADSVSTNVRYRWEYQPGSDLFIVYTEARNTRFGGFPELVNRAFAVKITRLIRF